MSQREFRRMIPRKYPRFVVHFLASFTGDSRHAGDVSNLSQRGCCLHDAMADLDVTDMFLLYLHVPGHEDPVRIDNAHMRWQAGSYFGIRFLFINMEEEERLVQYLAHLHASQCPVCHNLC
jgi:hypothetical protein